MSRSSDSAEAALRVADEEEGDIEGASGADRELPRRLQPRRQEVGLEQLELQLAAGRHDGAEEGGRPQGPQGCVKKS